MLLSPYSNSLSTEYYNNIHRYPSGEVRNKPIIWSKLGTYHSNFFPANHHQQSLHFLVTRLPSSPFRLIIYQFPSDSPVLIYLGFPILTRGSTKKSPEMKYQEMRRKRGRKERANLKKSVDEERKSQKPNAVKSEKGERQIKNQETPEKTPPKKEQRRELLMAAMMKRVSSSM